ncbi:MAG: hypothetical protein AB7O97_02185 [Planctomycetota bacterium]
MTARRGHGRGPAARALLLAALAAAACQGGGSDVGPGFEDLPGASFKVLVLDDAGAAVSGARVSIDGAAAATGRSGRGDLEASPRGRRLVRVDATAAAADAAQPERLVSLAFAAELPGQDLPLAVYLPDTGASPTLTLTAGVATTAQTLTAGGAQLDLPNGTVPADGAAGQVTLRLAELTSAQLPGELPAPPGGRYVFSRAIWVDPPTATFAPGVTVSTPDADLGFGPGDGAVLFRLDPDTGEWQQVSATQATSDGARTRLPGAVTRGGLYVHGFAQGALATVRGRVVDVLDRALPEVLVRVGASRAVTGGDGTFALAVPALLADGAPRTVAVDLRAGGSFQAAAVATTAGVTAGADVDLGDLELDTTLAGNVRVQLVHRGRAKGLVRLPFSSINGSAAGVAFADADGRCTLEDVGAGFYGFLTGSPLDRDQMQEAQGVPFLQFGRRWDAQFLFFDDRPWLIGTRSTAALVRDSIGGGPVRDAAVTRGRIPGAGFSGNTEDGGSVFVTRAFDGRATASVRTEYQGNAVISAFSIEGPSGDRLQLPVERALRPGGAFDRHGVALGALTGADPGREQRVRASRPLEFDEWFDQVMLGVAPTSPMPATPVAATGSSSFRAGVAQPRGHVAVAEGALAGAVFTLTGVGLALDLAVPEGTALARDLAIDLPADTVFTAPGALTDLDAGLSVADLRYDLALQQPSGLCVDVVRGVDGGIVVGGADVQLTLPALSGPLAGHAWLVALRARVTAGTAATDQRVMLRFDGGTVAVTPQLPVPVLTSPTDGANVAADGFAVQYTPPPNALYVTIELASAGTEALRWYAVVPPGDAQFDFVRLPTEAATPLVAGRTYTLQLTAYRADTGVILLQESPYRELTTHWMAIGTGERGVRAVSSTTIAVTAN